MSNEPNLKTEPSQLAIYQIRFNGHLDPRWRGWFGDVTVTLEADGDTLLTGPVDQAGLHGLLKKVRDLGVILVSVNRIEPDPSDAAGDV